MPSCMAMLNGRIFCGLLGDSSFCPSTASDTSETSGESLLGEHCMLLIFPLPMVLGCGSWLSDLLFPRCTHQLLCTVERPPVSSPGAGAGRALQQGHHSQPLPGSGGSHALCLCSVYCQGRVAVDVVCKWRRPRIFAVLFTVQPLIMSLWHVSVHRRMRVPLYVIFRS